MKSQEKIIQLRNLIDEQLTPIINHSECILVGAPYYHNIGDHLIWRGINDFFKCHHMSCRHTYSCFHHPHEGSISQECIIFFIGGGNIGDIYIDFSKQLARIVELFPENRIIIFPQTVYYQEKSNEQHFLEKYAQHKNLFFCARDRTTQQLLKQYLPTERVKLVPDMAFYINLAWLYGFTKDTTKDTLTIARNDGETNDSITISNDENVADWPTYDKDLPSVSINLWFIRIHFYHIPLRTAYDWSWNMFQTHYFSKHMIKLGVAFISPYRHIRTTRLHGAILAMLLNKEVTVFDNSYGKNKHFYETWLQDANEISLYCQ